MTAVHPSLNPDGRYTVTKIAQALDVSRQSVYNYHEAGTLRLRMSRPREGKKPTMFAYGREVNRFWERYF